MKKRFLFVFALLSMLMFTGCKENDKMLGTLSAPQEVTVMSDNGKSLIIFDEVENAEYYNVYINGMSITVKGTGAGTIQFDASKIITQPQNYTIKIKAGANKYFESEFSSEYEYTHMGALNTPIANIDGTTLNWNKIENADFYDVYVTTPSNMHSTHRSSTNKFDFTNILSERGDYTFKVKAISSTVEYESSEYSTPIKHTHKILLITPYKLQLSHDLTNSNNEQLITFVSSDYVEKFILEINGFEYELSGGDSKFFINDDLSNVYTLKLTSFIKTKNINVNNTELLTIRLKADNNSVSNLIDSGFSEAVTCKFVSALTAPTISSVNQVGDKCVIKIAENLNNISYLSGYTIYLDGEEYKNVPKTVTTVELPLLDVGTKGIRIQAISNNNNCYSSNLSSVKYVNNNAQTLSATNIKISGDIVSWDVVANAQQYYVEISNKIFRYTTTTTENELNLSTICGYGSYNVRIIAMAEGFNQSERTLEIKYQIKLQQVSNVNMAKVGDRTYLTFTEEANAYGYVIYLNGSIENKLFVGSPIDISGYITTGLSYNIQIKAISVANSFVVNGESSEIKELQSIKTLSAPKLNIVTEGDKHYLQIDVDEDEAPFASGYRLWINYILEISNGNFKDSYIDLTSYFVNAGEYNFMVQAIATEANEYVKDSIISSITQKITKQLDVVTDILVQKSNDKYILTFKQQTFAAKYLVTIKKADDETFNQQFELSSGYADISQYIPLNGVYRVYVKAIALEGSAYTNSAESGNPYRLVKGETLSAVKNISVVPTQNGASNGEMYITWDRITNASGYQVYVYYNEYGKNILKESVYVSQVANGSVPSLNVGSGEHKCIGKEGEYSIQIKTMGDGEQYENSQFATQLYTYNMKTVADFERYSAFMYGGHYTYNVTNYKQLQHLLWYHYLYNDETWRYDSVEYNLKIYFNGSADKLANDILEDFGTTAASELVSLVASYTENDDKMFAVANYLLKQYPEIAAYSYNSVRGEDGQIKQQLCYNEEQNIYMFKYDNVLNSDKLERVSTSAQVFKQKVNVVSSFDKRADGYIFAIDSKDSMNVTTTEQLFVALQYNKKPNFVGNSAVAEAVYQNAKFVLREICSDGMSDYNKVLQIYNFLTQNIAYNDMVSLGIASETVTAMSGETMRGNVADFYLEGVLYNFTEGSNGLFSSINDFKGQTAVCDGLSKAFVALCSIEGIDSIKVKNTGHAWNKVYIDVDINDDDNTKKWYVVDLTAAIQNNSITLSDGKKYQVALHDFFLTEDRITATYLHHRFGGGDAAYSAKTAYDYYQNTTCSARYGSSVQFDENLVVGSESEIKNLLIYAMLNSTKEYQVLILDTEDKDTYALRGNITGTYYQDAQKILGSTYYCNISVYGLNEQYIVITIKRS